MKMRKIFHTICFTAIVSLSIGPTASIQAATLQQMRFHCEKDTVKINELLKKGLASKKKTANELVSFYGHELLGTPYVAYTLEGEEELLTINIDELDCTTYVETLYALTRTTLSGRYSWRDYANNLENLRYRRGIIDGYASRLHYISDWSIENTSRGNITEVTSDLPAARTHIKNIDFMTSHRNTYPQLKDSTTYEQIRNFEKGYRNHKYFYIPKNQMGSRKLQESLHEGDFVGLTTKIEGLDVSHMGVIVKDDKGDIYLMDASMSGGKVQVETEDMNNMLRHNKTNQGIRVFRIKE